MWDAECQKDFDDIKQYHINLSILMVSVSSKPFLLDKRAVDNALGALPAQTNEKR